MQNENKQNETEGFLFDIYNVEEEIHVWILDKEGKPHLFLDHYFPIIYLDGEEKEVRRIIKRIEELNALKEIPVWVTRKHFYSNQDVRVVKVVISKPSVLRRISQKLYSFYRKVDIYHSDIDVATGYLYLKNIFPLAYVYIGYTQIKGNNRILSIHTKDDIKSCEYKIPNFKILNLTLKYSHRIGLNKDNPLSLSIQDRNYEINFSSPKESIFELNKILLKEDPDVILSSFGDQIILPRIFYLAQSFKIPLNLDRDKTTRNERKIITKGTSFNSFGIMIFKAPSYPLFGRWHIDSANSFVYKESMLMGIIELSRISRLPIQRLARSSTGTALTAIETDVALNLGYLVPWQKSKVEEPKSFYELLRIDKGGLTFQQDISNGSVFENMAQLDFAQMYPSVMVLHNLSPETVLCECCTKEKEIERVPTANYRICKKRRGVVSLALEHVLNRRTYYKQKKKETTGSEYEIVDAKQNSLKWMLVTSFGYLGYRNAKFGRIESHESVTAFGRDKLLRAKECAEDRDYLLSHAMTDSIFIHKRDSSILNPEELNDLCSEITRETKVTMAIEGVYKWLVYPPSKIDPLLPVSTRYFGKFYNNELKTRGIASRRKDTAIYIRKFQLELLQIMRQADTLNELKELHSDIHKKFQSYKEELESGTIAWKDLLLRRTIGKPIDEYSVANASFLSLSQLAKYKIEVSAGEKVRYLVIKDKHKDNRKRYITEEELFLTHHSPIHKYDIDYYSKQLWIALEEVWENFAPLEYFHFQPSTQLLLW